MEGVLKNEREKSERSFGKARQRGRDGRSRLLDEVCELCGYERKYAIKVLSGKRAIVCSDGRKREGSYLRRLIWRRLQVSVMERMAAILGPAS